MKANRDQMLSQARQAVEQGRVRAGVTAESLADLVQTLLFGLATMARNGASRDQLDEVRRLAMRAVLPAE